MKTILLLFLTFLVFKFVNGQTKDSFNNPSLQLELVLLDLPYQSDATKTVNNGNAKFGNFIRGYANPSMQQSLALSTDLYSATHFGIDRLFKKNKKRLGLGLKIAHQVSLLASDYVLSFAPLGDGWLHEEYHRAIMTRHQVNSFNSINLFPIGEDLASVDHVKDEDLIRFKIEAPRDFIRLHVAGIEGGYQLINRLQKNNFFNSQQITHEPLYWWITINSIDYVRSSSQADIVDVETDESNMEETTIEERDFTGFDFTAWAFDLFDPFENYDYRGQHPSGVGIDRYIKTTDLHEEALEYLNKQGNLQFLNLISPMLFFQKSIHLKNDWQFNFAIRHFLNAFGNDISLNIFLQKRNKNLVFVYHHASNFERSFPALELEVFEYPFQIKKQTFLFSPNIVFGTQPKDQDFFSKESAFLGQAKFRLEGIFNSINPWIELSAKTKGWIAANEFLASNFSVRFGLAKRFP